MIFMPNYNTKTSQENKNENSSAINSETKTVVKSKKSKSKNPIIGIQGGIGSFNELTLLENLEEIKQIINQKFSNNIIDTDFDLEIDYCFTTKKVLQNLENDEIDFGLFAFVNSLGGIVAETAAVLGSFSFTVLDNFKTQISHTLMKLPSQNLSQINQIMAHDQVFRQCSAQLKRKYGHLKQISGSGNLTDNGSIALALRDGLLPNTAILMSERMAEIYDFDVVEESLEDKPDNYTTFLLVGKLEK